MIIEFTLPRPVTTQQLNIFVRALCAYNTLWLRAHPETPNIYESGVVYKNQPVGCEHFKPIPLVLAAKSGDCDQLAPWRAAELRVRHNIRALPEVKQFGPTLWHVFVRYPDGRAEDISAHLGMRVPPKLAAAGYEKLRRKHGHERTPHRNRSAAVRPAWHAQWTSA